MAVYQYVVVLPLKGIKDVVHDLQMFEKQNVILPDVLCAWQFIFRHR